MSSSPHWKIEMSKNKTKVKKETKRKINNQRKMNEKKEMNERTTKNDFFRVVIKGILGLITLKHNLGLLILSFGTPNPGLHYVPKKSILIERGYLDWRASFLRKFFVINEVVVFFFSANKKILINLSLVQDEFWIVKCIIGQSKKWWKNENGKKKWL